MARFTVPIISALRCLLNINFPTIKQVKLNPKIIERLTEYTYFFDRFIIIFYKIILANKKGSGLCYLKVELNHMNY
jgi:hypothetical protein